MNGMKGVYPSDIDKRSIKPRWLKRTASINRKARRAAERQARKQSTKKGE